MYIVSVKDTYNDIVSGLHTAVEETLGLKKKPPSKQLWWNEEIEALVTEKKKDYKKYLSTKKEEYTLK